MSTYLTYLARPKLKHHFLQPLEHSKLRIEGLHQQQASWEDTEIEDSIKLHEGSDDPMPTQATWEASTLQDLNYEQRTFWFS
jgi:hypothetical protein